MLPLHPTKKALIGFAFALCIITPILPARNIKTCRNTAESQCCVKKHKKAIVAAACIIAAAFSGWYGWHWWNTKAEKPADPQPPIPPQDPSKLPSDPDKQPAQDPTSPPTSPLAQKPPTDPIPALPPSSPTHKEHAMEQSAPTTTPQTPPLHPEQRVLDPLNDGISSLQLIRVSGSDTDVVNAARVSYGEYVTEMSERDKKLIKYLTEHKHTSPFEHNQFSFRVKTPIFVTRQWMRHRMNSYNEKSYRYTKAPLEFYVPHVWRAQDKHNKQSSVDPFSNETLKKKYEDAIATCAKTYETLLENGVTRELARGLLPVCTYTEFIYTCNLLSLTHFLNLRIKPDAQQEIRKFARGMLELALPHFPVSLGEWQRIYGINL